MIYNSYSYEYQIAIESICTTISNQVDRDNHHVNTYVPTQLAEMIQTKIAPEGAFFLLPQCVEESKFTEIALALGIDQTKLNIALGFARDVHQNQLRDDGVRNHFTGHALLVPLYYTAIELYADRQIEEDVFLAGIMHDIKEDGPNFNDGYLTEVFGAIVVEHLHTMSKPPKSNYPTLSPTELDFARETDYIAQFDGKSIGIRTLKLADKITNTRDDIAKPLSAKSIAYAEETRALFIPFARAISFERPEYAAVLLTMLNNIDSIRTQSYFGSVN